jgi:hypothetical protein
MPSLQIQSMPQDLYGYIQELAFSQNDSLETQVIKLLYQAKQEKCQQTARFDKLIQQLNDYLNLKENWDGYSGVAPTEKQINDAIKFVKSLPQQIPLPEPMVAGSGTVGLYWESQGIYAEIGFEGDGTFWCYGEDNEGNEAGEDRLDLGSQLPADLLKMLKTLA